MNTKLLSTLAATSIVAMLIGIAFNSVAPALFAFAAIGAVVLIAVTDYAPAPCYHRVMCRVGHEQLPFAA